MTAWVSGSLLILQRKVLLISFSHHEAKLLRMHFLESLQPACRIGPILLSYTRLVTSGLPPTRFRDANGAENKQSRANLLSCCTLCDERLQVIVVITFLIYEMSDNYEKLVIIIYSFGHLYIVYHRI